MVKKGVFEFDGDEWDEVSNEAKDLIQKLICKPERRLSAEEALQHIWIRTLAKSSKVEKLSKVNIDTFKKFQYHQKLKQVALTAIAVNLNPKDIRQMKNAFKAMDKNGDGCLTVDELKSGLSGMGNKGDDVLALMRAVDLDHSGSINYTGKNFLSKYIPSIEFIAATLDAKIFMREENLRNAFIIFD